MKILFISFVLFSLLLSCSAEQSVVSPVDQTNNDSKIEKALSDLESLMAMIHEPESKSYVPKTIRDITSLSASDFGFSSEQTKSNDLSEDILCVVNFNEGGAAVLGTDYRLSPVIMMLDSGEIDPMSLVGVLPNPTPIQYTIDDFYNPETQDYYIGNLEGDEVVYPELVRSYIQRMLLHPTSNEDEYTYQLSTNAVLPILKTKWHQEAPFNNKIRKTSLSGERRPIGCTTLALLQILVANKDIPISLFGVTNSTWEDLEREKIYDFIDTPEYTQIKDDVATIALQLADGIDVYYNFLFSGQTFATPKQVCNYMQEIGYNHADVVMGFSLSSILNMLQLNKPVFIGALSGLYGHAWVIDGFVTRIATHNVTGDELRQMLLHCNWGWEGNSDGYYIPDLFDAEGFILPDNPADIDDEDAGFDASWWYRQIVY